MANVIHKSRLEDFLKKDGDIRLIISKTEMQEMKRMLFANKLSWAKISDLPQFVFDQFDKKMRQDCFVNEMHLTEPPEAGPMIVFEQYKNDSFISISDHDKPKGIKHYRNCLAVVAYFVGICGGIIQPTLEEGRYFFTDEDWIIISIAARFCLMPPKYIDKVYLLTQMYEENGEGNGKPFLHNFIDNLVFQTNVPEWVVMSRLHEHAFASEEFSAIFNRRTIEELVEEYRENEHYRDELV